MLLHTNLAILVIALSLQFPEAKAGFFNNDKWAVGPALIRSPDGKIVRDDFRVGPAVIREKGGKMVYLDPVASEAIISAPNNPIVRHHDTSDGASRSDASHFPPSRHLDRRPHGRRLRPVNNPARAPGVVPEPDEPPRLVIVNNPRWPSKVSKATTPSPPASQPVPPISPAPPAAPKPPKPPAPEPETKPEPAPSDDYDDYPEFGDDHGGWPCWNYPDSDDYDEWRRKVRVIHLDTSDD